MKQYLDLLNHVLEKVLEKGFRTKDIYQPKTNLVSTSEMGNIISEEIKTLSRTI